MIKNLEPPDTHFANAAIGWLELGNPAEAAAELKGLSPAARQHPDVLEVEWMIHERLKDWVSALRVARALVQCAPDRVTGWLHQAYAMRRAPEGGLEPAFKILSAVATLFPEEPTLAYNLACYHAQLGRLDEAWTWLLKAKKLLGRNALLKMAQADSDLAPLAGRFHEL